MSKRPYQVKVYQTPTGGWSWWLKAPNSKIIARANDDYATRQHAIRSARDVMNAIQTADIVCP